MRLEPGRTSLSGRPEFLRPPVAVQTPAIAFAPRICVACGARDQVQMLDGEPENSVGVELQFLQAANEEVARRQITPYLKAKGWRYKFHLGRHAMERDICKPCLMAYRELRLEFQRKRTGEVKSSMRKDTYYSALCGE